MIRRQLRLFVEEHAALLERCERAERAYDAAGRDEAEERYAEYLDLVDDGAEALAAMRDSYASTLGPRQAESYAEAFGREVSRRLPRFGTALEET